MKQTLKIILTLCLILFVLNTINSQKKTDYERQVIKLQKYYNEGMIDSLCSLVRVSKEHPKCYWDEDLLVSLKNSFGNIISARYMLLDSITRNKGVTYIKIVGDKRIYILGCILNQDNKFTKLENGIWELLIRIVYNINNEDILR